MDNLCFLYFFFLSAVQIPRSLKERLGLPAEQNNMETGNFLFEYRKVYFLSISGGLDIQSLAFLL